MVDYDKSPSTIPPLTKVSLNLTLLFSAIITLVNQSHSSGKTIPGTHTVLTSDITLIAVLVSKKAGRK